MCIKSKTHFKKMKPYLYFSLKNLVRTVPLVTVWVISTTVSSVPFLEKPFSPKVTSVGEPLITAGH